MGRELVVSSGDALRRISLEDGCEKQRVLLERAGALCIAGDSVYCACGDVIWRLDKRKLTPTGLFGGGPGICSMKASLDGERLFALCSEGDSVLMLNAEDGKPILFNRAGVNPREMVMDGEALAIAGGESGLALILCSRSLRMMGAFSMPGPVYSVALQAGTLYALCLTAELSSVLVTQRRGGMRSMLALAGMPGSLMLRGNCLLAATDHALHTVSLDGKQMIGSICIPGRPVWMADAGEEMLFVDGYSEKLFVSSRNGVRLLIHQASFAALSGV